MSAIRLDAFASAGSYESIEPTLLASIQEAVRSASTILIGTHLNPDGDALGSALAVSHWLDGLQKHNEPLCHHPAPKNLRFLPGVNKIRQQPTLEEYDLGIIVDLEAMDRLGLMEPFFHRCKRLIVIDHHIPHEQPGDIRLVDTRAPATAVLLTRLFLNLGASITPAIGTCLLTGIVTDTGSFRFRNTTSESLILSAILLELGADLNLVSDEVFQRKAIGGVRLLGQALNSMHLEMDDRIAWTCITNESFAETGAKDEDTEGFVNELLSIDTVQIAALLRESKPGSLRVSLRSRSEIDVAEVARLFGGGGHRNAAGCTLTGDFDLAVHQLVEAMKHCLASH